MVRVLLDSRAALTPLFVFMRAFSWNSVVLGGIAANAPAITVP
jgi:hypothetical protein